MSVEATGHRCPLAGALVRCSRHLCPWRTANIRMLRGFQGRTVRKRLAVSHFAGWRKERMDPFDWCVGLGPVAVYLLLLGAVNLARRPLVVSGARDAAVLALAGSGLVVVGPLELFFPVHASISYGPAVWLFLIGLYALAVVLVLLFMRPRIVVYNVPVEELRAVVARLAVDLDHEARWAGDALALPNLGVQLHVEQVAGLRNVSLVACGPDQNPQSWRRLEIALAAQLATVEVPRSRRALALLAAGVALCAALVLTIARDPYAVAQSLQATLGW